MKDKWITVEMGFEKGDEEEFVVSSQFTVEGGGTKLDAHSYKPGETVKGILTRYEEEPGVEPSKVRTTGGECHIDVSGHVKDYKTPLLGVGVVPGEFLELEDRNPSTVFLKVPYWGESEA